MPQTRLAATWKRTQANQSFGAGLAAGQSQDWQSNRPKPISTAVGMPRIEAKVGVVLNPGLPPLIRIFDPKKIQQLELILRRNALTAIRIQP